MMVRSITGKGREAEDSNLEITSAANQFLMFDPKQSCDDFFHAIYGIEYAVFINLLKIIMFKDEFSTNNLPLVSEEIVLTIIT